MRLQGKLDLERDLAEVQLLAAERGWEVHAPDDGVVEVALASKIDQERYWLRFRIPEYPDPWSIHPFDRATGNTQVKTAWPACQGFRPMNDLCLPLSAEGYQSHPNWKTDPGTKWVAEGNPLLRVIEELQMLLNDPDKYQGRGA